MSTPHPNAEPTPHGVPPPAATGRRWRRTVVLALPGLLFALLLLTGGITLAALMTEWGARTVWRTATGALGGKLTGKLVNGNLADGLVLQDVQYRDAGRIVRLDRFAGAWHLSLSPALLTIDYLRLGQLDVTLPPSPPEPLRLPGQLTSPLAFNLKSLDLQKLILHNAGGAMQVSDLRASARSDRVHHQLQVDHAATPYGAVQGALRLDGTAPFAIDGAVGLATLFEQQRYAVDGKLSGSLQALRMNLRAGGGKLEGTADIEATPFDAVPFRQVRIDLQHLDPRVFLPAAPHADLTMHATLSPIAGATAAPGGIEPKQSVEQPVELVVGGPVAITNAVPGPLDQGRLPLVAAQADVLLNAKVQQLSRLNVTLPDNATVSGNGAVHSDGQGAFKLRVAQLDLHAIHGALLATRLAGPVDIDLHKGAQDLALQLDSKTLSIAADAHADVREIRLHSVRLQAGESQVRLSGALERDGQSKYALKGALKDFDPATVLAQVRPSPARTAPAKDGRARAAPRHARINMEFTADGALQPELDARIGFAIRDSTYDALPMTGGGTAQVLGKRLLASDVRLSIAGNDATITGSFGTAADRLAFHVDAPALARLGFGLAGQVQADGRLAGSIAQPVVDATYRARDLVLGEHRLAALTGEAHINGLPGENPNARLAVTLDARGIHGGPADLEQLNARIDGSFAQHTIDLKAAGRLGGQPLALTLAAQGNLKQVPGLSWSGVVRTLENRGVPRLSIGAPLTISVAADRLELGATRLTLGPADIDLKGFAYRPGLLRTQGSFNALRVADVLELQRRLTGAAVPVTTSLVLDGSWNIELGTTARGFAQITRRSGDVVVATPYGANALGLGMLRLRADLQGDRVRIDSRVDASRVGTLAARGDIGLVRGGALPGIGPASTLSGSLEGALPTLRNFAGMTGPAIALDGSVNVALTATGTLGKPVVSGNINGDRLALTLFDQGVRLRNGTARIALSNNFVDLRDVVFHGGSGTLRATGRIPLDQSDTGLTALITADKLQLLNDPSRKLTLSGQARMANVAQRLTVTGRFVVDQGRFSLPEKSAPRLSDDVVILQPGAVPKRDSARPPGQPAPAGAQSSLLPPKVDVVVDLGNDLRFKGGGADLFLAGAFDIRSGPNQPPQAFGTVRVVSGIYEAFGARLAIERGLITFQGPFDNPSINILAMRRNQAVPAGVQVTGNVQQPRVELVSEPNLGEDQKLSWLVFGRGDTTSGSSGGSSSQARGAVQSAALGLANKFGGSRLAENIGLDKLSIGASEYGTGTGQVVNLGKEISNKLFIGYEQGLAGAESAVKLTYELTQHWSLVLRGGAVAGLDVNYSRRFDRLQGR